MKSQQTHLHCLIMPCHQLRRPLRGRVSETANKDLKRTMTKSGRNALTTNRTEPIVNSKKIGD